MTSIPAPPSNYATVDFETYSEAGYLFVNGKWKSAVKGKPGLKSTGSYNYARHPTTCVLSMCYDMHDGAGVRLWFPGLPDPVELFEHVRNGGIIEAHNSIFEYWIWKHVCCARMGWVDLPLNQLSCTLARCSATGLPKGLGNVHKAIDLPVAKQDIGKKIIQRLSVPTNYKKKKYTMGQMHEYCVYDVMTEDAISQRIPVLDATERRIWEMDQRINDRGVQIDVAAVKALAQRIEKYVNQAGRELARLSHGAINSPRETERIGKWLEWRGVKVKQTVKNRYKMDKEAVEQMLTEVAPGSTEYQVLDLRQQFALASVDKIKTMAHMVDETGRLRGLFRYYGAHTGRWTSLGVQLQNLARGGLKPEEVKRILDEIKCDNWSSIEGESPLKTISSLIRGLFIAAPGKELVCADFSAIEGRGAAMLCGEQWRIDVFRGDGNIYERTAADLTGIDYQEFLDHFSRTGTHHPMRGLGKTGELASQYGGWIDAWLRFGAGKYFKKREELKELILKWRAASPCMQDMWGGQVRKHDKRWEWSAEIWGLEGAAVNALRFPETWFGHKGIKFKHDTLNDVLLCRLPSGRCLWYRNPRIEQDFHRHSERLIWKISYKTWSDKDGWHYKDSYGARFFENIVQAVCRDIMAMSMLRLEDHGYPLVIHVHDEPVTEVPRGFGSLSEVTELMEVTEGWFADYPIVAGGAWRGDFYRK